MTLLVVYNPVSGNSSGREIVDGQVLPLLKTRGVEPDKVIGTEHVGHAGTIVADFASASPANSDLNIVLVSGDGTLHEIVNALHDRSWPSPLNLKLALIPGGTANALHSSFFPPVPGSETTLSSVYALLDSDQRLTPLALAYTTISASPLSPAGEQTSVLSAVVASTSLHASILLDAEALRATVPSIERFKLAAAQNATRWYNARLRLLPAPATSDPPSGAPAPVLQYDPPLDQFVAAPSPAATSGDEGPTAALELSGPFAYMLSTVNVDRLEPAFRITPLQRAHPPVPPATADIVVVRPSRDPSVKDSSDAEREKFKDKVWATMGGAYQDGAHVRSTYAEDGSIVSTGTGQPVVEYFRAGGWEWIPDEDDDRAHYVCADGAIHTIPKGGKATTRVLGKAELGFTISLYT
ncbi:unnamed protein product [Peniophora sp. CBMAI 1063]|nr:unnamed protein product [Peniophora sp. CBMAI 1063]